MIHVITLSTGRGHDGGIGNGRAMIAADSAGHAGGDADDAKRIAHIENVLNDRDQHTEGAPGGSGGEGQEAGNDENDGGQEVLEAGSAVLDERSDIILGAQRIGHALQGPCEGQNQDRGDHGLEAFGNAFHDLTELHGATAQEVDDAENESDRGTDSQTHGSVRVGEGNLEVFAGEETAGVDHAQGAGDDQHNDGENQVDNLTLSVDTFFLSAVFVGVFAGEKIAGFEGVLFKLGHGAVIHLHEHEAEHHDDGQNRVEVIGNRVGEKRKTGAVFGKTGNCRCPGGNGSNDADRSGGSVNDVGQLGTGNVVLVGHRTHHAADGEAVEIVIDENQHAQYDRRDLRANAGLDVGLSPTSESGGTASLVHQADQSAQDDQEQQDTDIVGVRQRSHDPAREDVVHCRFQIEIGIQEAACNDTDEQGTVDFLGQQSQHDGNDGRKQGPPSVIEGGGRRFIFSGFFCFSDFFNRDISSFGSRGDIFGQHGEDGGDSQQGNEQKNAQSAKERGESHMIHSYQKMS